MYDITQQVDLYDIKLIATCFSMSTVLLLPQSFLQDIGISINDSKG